jgi:hypothetical protein
LSDIIVSPAAEDRSSVSCDNENPRPGVRMIGVQG